MRFKMDNPEILEKVDNLLGKMTLQEKVSQLGCLDAKREGGVEYIKKHGAGLIAAAMDAKTMNELQRYAVEETRLGIPYLFVHDVIQGWKTIFPIPFAETCSFDMELIERTSKAAAEEGKAAGSSLTFAPMLDIARDPRWGRIAEGAGEDPYLASRAGEARIKGYQSVSDDKRRYAGCMKHFAAYGAGEGGRDYTNNMVSERVLRETYLPPFEACVNAGVESVMPAFTDVLGVPCTANKKLLKNILRDEMGFDGVVISDYDAIYELIPHGVAASCEEACKLAIEAGVDVDINADIYLYYLEKLVKEGEVSIETVDASVKRVLYLKYYLGLFDSPYCDEEEETKVLMAPEHLALAKESAEKSAVLLKNRNQVLPLSKNQKVAVVGPLAEEADAYIGWWRCIGKPEDVVTVRQGIENVVGKSGMTYTRGCDIESGEVEWEAVQEAVQEADVIVAVLGETSLQSGEAHCRSNLELPGRQNELIRLLAQTGKPIVAVLIAGRPLSAVVASECADALLMAWEPGTMGGEAVADLLYGKCVPSGKLCVSIPRSSAVIPAYYNHFNGGRPNVNEGAQKELGIHYEAPYCYGNNDTAKYIDALHTPLYPFGYGLSYTNYEYRDFKLDKKEIREGETIYAEVTVTNTGSFEGDEIVQMYIQDAAASAVRPVKELKGFQRVHIKPGESVKVKMPVTTELLKFHDMDCNYILEPGLFRIWMGPSSVQGNMDTFTLV